MLAISALSLTTTQLAVVVGLEIVIINVIVIIEHKIVGRKGLSRRKVFKRNSNEKKHNRQHQCTDIIFHPMLAISALKLTRTQPAVVPTADSPVLRGVEFQLGR
jgi:hypothetical protein